MGQWAAVRKKRSTRREFPSTDPNPPSPTRRKRILCPTRTSLKISTPSFRLLAVVSPRFCPEIGRAICARSLDSPQILDFATRLSTATSSHVSELSAQLALLRKQLVDACSFLPPYDQRQYDMVPISPTALDVIVDDVWCSATKIVGTSFREAADEPDLCGNQAKVCV